MITKSELKALNNAVKIKLDGEWVYTEIDNVEIGGVLLKDFLTKAKQDTAEVLESVEKNLHEKIDTLKDEVKALRTAFEDTLKGLMTR
jgi:hypothetical protein